MAGNLCKKCNKTKPLSEFYRDSSSKSGHHRYCKSCVKIYMDKYSKTYIRRKDTGGITKSSGRTDLSSLLEIKNINDKMIESIVEARTIFRCYIKAYSSACDSDGMMRIMKENGIDKSLPVVNRLIRELKEAAKNNMTLEEYFKNGRPFKQNTQKARLLISKDE